MQRSWCVALTALSFVLASEPVHACRVRALLDLNDVKYADVVLVGRVSNYQIVRDVEFRREKLADPKHPLDLLKTYESTASLMSDYARFDIQVNQVLTGKAPTRLAVTWDNSTFEIPEKMASGPFLIALRKPSSEIPPLRGPSATILPSREPGSMAVLQAPCSSPFIFESTSNEARTVRLILKARPR